MVDSGFYWFVVEGCLEEERIALLQLKPFFFPSIEIKEEAAPWGKDSNCCNWNRVECNSTTGKGVVLAGYFILAYLPWVVLGMWCSSSRWLWVGAAEWRPDFGAMNSWTSEEDQEGKRFSRLANFE
ncbi:hypothetical protein Tsubulata_047776 [Turnera subulata]|uniref:Leucine-rich repeat-containing N-terminal plant-type domain-containing protein n=1 Tax=Turnera subulata TaxID=218843 RepID=A0A9Q0J1X0_9ROSI|nr:hypothetical protein Tsubulata_047776 [Turnera subulata]